MSQVVASRSTKLLLLLLLLRRTGTAQSLRSCALLHSPTCHCFATRAQVPPPSSGDSSDAKSSSDVNKTDVQSNEDDASSSNPWRHFQAFSSMDEYMDVTLIHYANKGESGVTTEKATKCESCQPHDAAHKPTPQDK